MHLLFSARIYHVARIHTLLLTCEWNQTMRIKSIICIDVSVICVVTILGVVGVLTLLTVINYVSVICILYTPTVLGVPNVITNIYTASVVYAVNDITWFNHCLNQYDTFIDIFKFTTFFPRINTGFLNLNSLIQIVAGWCCSDRIDADRCGLMEGNAGWYLLTQIVAGLVICDVVGQCWSILVNAIQCSLVHVVGGRRRL